VKIAVLNGPNLNLLGTREPALYGKETLADIERRLRDVAKQLGADLEFAQHNGEGEMIDRIHSWRGKIDGVVINAGAYSHSSLAIRDALSAISVPYVEVHLTNIYARVCGHGRDLRARRVRLRGRIARAHSQADAE